MTFAKWLAVSAALLEPACAAGGPCGGQGRHRRHRRSVGRLCGRERPAGGRGDQDGDRRFRRQRARPADRVPDRGPPEQARHRREQVPRMGRHQGAHHAARRLQHRREPGARADRQGEEDSAVRHRRRGRIADRQGLQRLHGPLRLRYDGARQRHGQDDRRIRAANPGSSSRRTMRSAPSFSRRRPRSSTPAAARSWAS